MPVKNQTGYLGLLLMLAALNVEINPAQAALSPETETIQGRIARIKRVLQAKSTAIEGQSSPLPFTDENLKEEELSFWVDWTDSSRRRRGGSGGWVDAWAPGWGDWADTSRWGDWGDFW